LITTQFTQVSLIPKMNPSVRTAIPKMLMKRADGVGQGVALVGDTYSDVSRDDTRSSAGATWMRLAGQR
jgi:hypothetical protein